mmetsp:Transcript_26064/g.62786  ORF Transcript_26064/g.62786 Transcript_26064/m.62786 type:complete len:302 (+) Transcript_26064:1258-2163(+)
MCLVASSPLGFCLNSRFTLTTDISMLSFASDAGLNPETYFSLSRGSRISIFQSASNFTSSVLAAPKLKCAFAFWKKFCFHSLKSSSIESSSSPSPTSNNRLPPSFARRLSVFLPISQNFSYCLFPSAKTLKVISLNRSRCSCDLSHSSNPCALSVGSPSPNVDIRNTANFSLGRSSSWSYSSRSWTVGLYPFLRASFARVCANSSDVPVCVAKNIDIGTKFSSSSSASLSSSGSSVCSSAYVGVLQKSLYAITSARASPARRAASTKPSSAMSAFLCWCSEGRGADRWSMTAGETTAGRSW